MVVASNRAASGVYADRAGPVLVEGLRALGFDVGPAQVVPDGGPVGEALRAAVEDDERVEDVPSTKGVL